MVKMEQRTERPKQREFYSLRYIKLKKFILYLNSEVCVFVGGGYEVIDSDIHFFFSVGEVSCPKYQFTYLYKNSSILPFLEYNLMIHCRDLVGENHRYAFNIYK